MGAIALPLSARPARMATESGWSGTPPGPLGASSVGASSGVVTFTHLTQELDQGLAHAVLLDEEGVVAVGGVELDVLDRHADGSQGGRHLPLLADGVEEVAGDAESQHGDLHAAQRGGDPAAAPGDVVEVHGLGQGHVRAGVEPAHELVTVVVEVALDLVAVVLAEGLLTVERLAPEALLEHRVGAEGDLGDLAGQGQAAVGALAGRGVVVVTAPPAGVLHDGLSPEGAP